MVALEEIETDRQVGCMIMWILDLYLEGVVPLPDDDLIAARINYLCEKYNMTRSLNEKFFRVEMASQMDMALDQLNHIIDAIFSSVEKCLQSLYTAFDHQLQDVTDG